MMESGGTKSALQLWAKLSTMRRRFTKEETNMTYWNIEALTGYQPKTTFWQDFEILELFRQMIISYSKLLILFVL